MAWNTVYETADLSAPCGGEVLSLWLLAALTLTAIAIPRYRRADASARRRTLRVLAALLIADEGMKYAVVLSAEVPLTPYLPMHLCSLSAIPAALYAASRNRDAGEYLYAVALPGASLALLFPGWLALPPDSLLSVHSFSFHILLCLITVLPTAAGELRPDVRRLARLIPVLAVWLALAGAVNAAAGTNFFFLRPDAASPLSPLAARCGESMYPIVLAALPLPLWLLMYLPWREKNSRAKTLDRQRKL